MAMEKRIFRIINIAVLFLMSVAAFAQSDVLVMRDGSEKIVRIIMVSNSCVTYSERAKGGPELTENLANIYMLHYDKRGNVFVDSEGNRKTGMSQRYDRNADLIYLISGKEIQAYNLHIDGNRVMYEEKGRTNIFGKRVDANLHPSRVLSTAEIFFIKYKDGTKDIMNDLSVAAKEKERKDAEKQEKEKPKSADEMKVLFHNVKYGETLDIIAKRYHVVCSDLIEWNDLPKNFRHNAKLKPDMQLMIYVKNSD